MKEQAEYSLVYITTKFDRTDSEYKEGDWNCYFKKGKKEICFRRTKTLEAAKFVKGGKYVIRTDVFGNPNYVLGNGIEIIRKGNKIIRHDIATNRFYNLTAGVEVDSNFKPLDGRKVADGVKNYNMAALNKFGRGELTKDLLLKMNERGVFFTIHSYEATGNSFANFSAGITFQGKKNTVIIEKYKQEEIDYQLKNIKQHYLKGGLQNFFEITTSLLPPKKSRKK